MPVGATQIAVALALAVTAGYAWSVGGLALLRRRLTDRFLYGVPWGSALVVGLVLAFYLFAQSGLGHWTDPVTLPFRSWSYYYPTGMLAAGFAHASPGHLVSNLTGTLVFAPLVEYVWGHYPPEGDGEFRGYLRDTDQAGPDSGADDPGGWLARPGVRALVVFPVVVLAVSVLTSVLAFGYSLGFSGTVFAFVGLALVYYPLTTVVALLVNAVVGVVYLALTRPVLRATAEPGPPGPPDWFGVNVQAHGLGLLIGVILGVALLVRRNRRPDASRVLLASLLVTIALGLYELPWAEDDVFFQYRGIGLVVVLGLAVLVTASVASSPRPLAAARTPRLLAFAWLGLVGVGTLLGVAAVVVSDGAGPAALVPLAVLAGLLAVPAAYVVLTTAPGTTAVTRRQVAVTGLVAFAAAVALTSVPFNLAAVSGNPAPGDGTVQVRDYQVVYGENVSPGAVFAIDPAEPIGSNDSGVMVVSAEREVWTDAVSKRDLAHAGNETVVLGGIGWRETVRAERTGWTVEGNESAYVVDLHHDGETIRSFRSDPVSASPTVDHRAFAVVPTDEGFDLRVTVNGTTVGQVPIPDPGESTAVAEVRITTETVRGTDRVVVERGGTSVTVAERETYD